MRSEPDLREPPPGHARAWVTRTTGPSRKRERSGGCPVSHHIGAVSADKNLYGGVYGGSGRNPSRPRGSALFAVGPNVTASVRALGVGDDLQAHQTPSAQRALDRSADRAPRDLLAWTRMFRACDRSGAVSHAALAAVLRLEDVSVGERLAAFSLASFANREHRAWPGTPVAAARAGLSRSKYLAACDGLVRRDLVTIDEPSGGRGRSTVILLAFAVRVRGGTQTSTQAWWRQCSATAVRAGQRVCCSRPWPRHRRSARRIRWALHGRDSSGGGNG